MNKKQQKILFIISMISCVAVLVLTVLQLTNVWENANYVTVPLLGLITLTNAVKYWKSDRKTAIFFLCVAIFVFIASAIGFLLR